MLQLLLVSDGYICAKGQTARLVRHNILCWSSEQPLGLDGGVLNSHWGWMWSSEQPLGLDGGLLNSHWGWMLVFCVVFTITTFV